MTKYLILIFIAFASTCARSEAAIEFCPATVHDFVPVHATASTEDLGTDNMFAFRLESEVPRAVNGTLAIYSGGDLYEAPFHAEIAAHQRKMQIIRQRGPNVIFSYGDFESAPQYLHFKTEHTVDAAWVSEAAATGQPARQCPTLPLAASKAKSDLIDDMRSLIAANPVPNNLTEAVLSAHVDSGSCHTIFAAASAIELRIPDYPQAAMSENLGYTIVIAKVALDAGGKLLDTWLLGSSGNDAIDNAALRAVRRSTFRPAQFLCVGVPGLYTFRAEFAPSP